MKKYSNFPKKGIVRTIKKGLMQQLFSGNWFKDENGNDYADWEKKLGKYLTYKIK
jgi:hypothetical protein